VPTELECWLILECLARAAVVLELGREDLPYPRPIRQPYGVGIAHFDLKPNNGKFISHFLRLMAFTDILQSS